MDIWGLLEDLGCVNNILGLYPGNPSITLGRHGLYSKLLRVLGVAKKKRFYKGYVNYIGAI